jgi:hypothetical protein
LGDLTGLDAVEVPFHPDIDFSPIRQPEFRAVQ